RSVLIRARSPCTKSASHSSSSEVRGLFLALLLFLLALLALVGRFGLLGLLFLLLAEDGLVTLGEVLGLGQADADDAHGTTSQTDLGYQLSPFPSPPEGGNRIASL